MTPERLAEAYERQMRYRKAQLDNWRKRQSAVDAAYAARRDAQLDADMTALLAAVDEDEMRAWTGDGCRGADE